MPQGIDLRKLSSAQTFRPPSATVSSCEFGEIALDFMAAPRGLWESLGAQIQLVDACRTRLSS